MITTVGNAYERKGKVIKVVINVGNEEKEIDQQALNVGGRKDLKKLNQEKLYKWATTMLKTRYKLDITYKGEYYTDVTKLLKDIGVSENNFICYVTNRGKKVGLESELEIEELKMYQKSIVYNLKLCSKKKGGNVRRTGGVEYKGYYINSLVELAYVLGTTPKRLQMFLYNYNLKKEDGIETIIKGYSNTLKAILEKKITKM